MFVEFNFFGGVEGEGWGFVYVCSVFLCDRIEGFFFGFKRSNFCVFRMYVCLIFEVCMVYMFYRFFYFCWIRINIYLEKKLR